MVEILSSTTETLGHTLKMADYVAHGVMEYWIIDPVPQSAAQYFLENEAFVLYAKLVKEGTLQGLLEIIVLN